MAKKFTQAQIQASADRVVARLNKRNDSIRAVKAETSRRIAAGEYRRPVRVPDHRPGKVESLNSYVAAGGTRAQRMAKRITSILDKDREKAAAWKRNVPSLPVKVDYTSQSTTRLSGNQEKQLRLDTRAARAILKENPSQRFDQVNPAMISAKRDQRDAKAVALRSERAFEKKERAIQEHYANEQLREAIKRGASFSDGEDDYTQEARDSVAAHLRKERAARRNAGGGGGGKGRGNWGHRGRPGKRGGSA